MDKLCNIYKQLLTGLLVLVSVVMFAQPDTYNRANELYRAKKTEQAARAIDSVIVHPETMNDPASWTVRAFIYYDIYKQTDIRKADSKLRDTIIASLKKSYSLKPDSDLVSNNHRMITPLSTHYFNIARAQLQDSINYDRSLKSYNKYKETKRISTPNYNFKQEDVSYYLAVGSVYSEVFTRENKKLKDFDKAINPKNLEITEMAFHKVLELEPNNVSANMNLGLLYYNLGVTISENMDWDLDIDKIDIVQEQMIKLAKKAEPYALKVYTNDNNNVKAITALYYVYRMLNDIPKSDEFKVKLKQHGINVEEENKTNEQK